MTKLKVRVVMFPSPITRVFHYVYFASYGLSHLILALLIKHCISQVSTDCRSSESTLNQTVTQHKMTYPFLMRVMCSQSF
jgi:hypothetical protein